MALADDARNHARGHVEEICDESGEYSQIVLTVTIEAEQWAAAQADAAAAAALVAWLAANVAA